MGTGGCPPLADAELLDAIAGDLPVGTPRRPAAPRNTRRARGRREGRKATTARGFGSRWRTC
eukprot:gene1531-15392_t